MTPEVEREALRERLLMATLPHVVFDGWTAKAIAVAAKDVGLDETERDRHFPGGPGEMVAYFSRWADDRMAQSLEGRDLAAMRVRDRVGTAVRARIEAVAPRREAVRRGLTFFALPGNAPLGLKCLFRTVDRTWHAAGDRSADFSYYTKRALLAGVYSATVLYWLEDRSDEFSETWAFLDRRIADVMRVHSLRGRAETISRSIPNPFRIVTAVAQRRR